MQQWNQFFQQKQDYLGSATVPAGGGTFTGKVNFAASTAGTAAMNCGVGATPSTPVNGDIWCTSVGMFVQINGGTVGPLGSGGAGVLVVSGGGTGVATIASGNVLIGQGTSPITNYPTSGTAARIASTTITSANNGVCVSVGAAGDLIPTSGACTTGGGGGTVSSATTGQLAIYTNGAGAVVSGLTGCNSGYIGTNGGGTVSCQTSLLAALQASITQVGTIATGVWQGTVVGATYGGTGVNNGANTVSLGGNFAISGAAVTLTAIGSTNVTLPTSGTIPNSNGTSGGVPYYNTPSSIASSAALGANLPVFGAGTGAAPFSGTRLGNTTKAQMANASTTPVTNDCVSYDANGNTQDSGQPCGSANAAPVLLATLTASASSSLTDVGNCSTGGSTGCLSTTYAAYRIDINQLVATSPAGGVGCQIAVWNGTYQVTGYITANSAAISSTTNIPCWPLGSNGGSNTMGVPGVSGSITVYSPGAVGKAQWIGLFSPTTGTTGAPVTNPFSVSGWWNTNSALSGFRVCFGTVGGTCASSIASGTIKVYGLP